MVTIARYADVANAQRDRSLLEAAGISAFLAGENSASAGYGGILGELQLQVPEADADRARRILKEHEGFAPLPDDFVPPDELPTERKQETMQTSIKNVLWSVTITLLIVFLALKAFPSRGESNVVSNERLRQEYQERAKRAEALMAAQEESHKHYVEYFARVNEDQQRLRASLERQEKLQQRFEGILTTWEKQQEQYQKYLDKLTNAPTPSSRP